MYALLMDGPGDTLPELPGVPDRGESPHHKFSKVTETGNDCETSTANRSQQMGDHSVIIRFMNSYWQVVVGEWACQFWSAPRFRLRRYAVTPTRPPADTLPRAPSLT